MSYLELGTLSYKPELGIVTFALLQVPELGAILTSSPRIELGIVSSFTKILPNSTALNYTVRFAEFQRFSYNQFTLNCIAKLKVLIYDKILK